MNQQARYKFTRDTATSLINHQRRLEHDPLTSPPLNRLLIQLLKEFEMDKVEGVLAEAREEALAVLERRKGRQITKFVLESTREAALARWKKSCL